MYKKGLEVLRLFKNHTLKTSLLDDFMYYENRQKILQEEKARLLVRSFESPFFVPALGPPRKLNCVVELPPSKIENANNLNDDPNNSKKTTISTSKQVSSEPNITHTFIRNEKSEQTGIEAKDNVSTLKIGSLSINSKPADSTSSVGTSAVPCAETFDLTVGSVPLKFNGTAKSPGILTVGTIPLDPRALLLGKGDAAGKKGSQQK